jgi:excisionase family DNA binding protein
MTARSDTGHAPSRRENSPRAVPSTLEAVVLQLRAALAIAEAALDQGVTGRPTVYTVAEVADITGCSEETVRRRIRDGRLDAVTSGARWLVSAAVLDRYLSGDSSSSTTAA